MHHGPQDPDEAALRRTLTQQGKGTNADVWIAWLVDWFRWSRGA